MKHILITLFATVISLGQVNKFKQTDSLKPINTIIKTVKDTSPNKSIIKSDTINIGTLSTIETIVPIDAKNDSKIVIVKDVSKDDYSRYIISLVSLLVGFFLNKIFEWFGDRKKIRKSGERWIVELRSLEEPIEAQIQALEKFTKEVGKDGAVPNLNIFSAINGDVFKSLDKNDLIKYIEQKNSKSIFIFPLFRNKQQKLDDFKKTVKISNKTHGLIAGIIHNYEMVQDRFNSFLTGRSQHTTSLSKHLQAFMRTFAHYGVELEKLPGVDLKTDPRYKPIADLFMKEIIPYLEDGKFIPNRLRDNFFIPVIGILSTFRLDPLVNELGAAVSECLSDIGGIGMEEVYVNENVETLIERYKELLEDLKPLINEIDGSSKST